MGSSGLHKLKRKVDGRRAALALLRSQDYRKFEWLLEKLDLVYKPRPFVYRRTLRRKHTEILTNLLCDETRNFKLQSLKDELESKQPEYLRRKANILSKISAEEQELKLPVTVSKIEIEECSKEAEQSTKDFFIFEEKQKEIEHKVLDN